MKEFKSCPECNSVHTEVVDIEFNGGGYAAWTEKCLECLFEFANFSENCKELDI